MRETPIVIQTSSLDTLKHESDPSASGLRVAVAMNLPDRVRIPSANGVDILSIFEARLR